MEEEGVGEMCPQPRNYRGFGAQGVAWTIPPSRKHLMSTWDLMSTLLTYFCCHSRPRMQDVT